MDRQALLPAVYPVPRNLGRFWTDPALYFSLLPRDILQYCLEPLLAWNATSELVGERLVPPRMVRSAMLERFREDLTLLANGKFMIRSIVWPDNQLGHWDPDSADSAIQWLIKDLTGNYEFEYDVNQDCLYLINEPLNNHQVIPHFSQIQTPEQFQLAQATSPLLPGDPNLSALVDSRIQWNLRPLEDPAIVPAVGDRVDSLTITISGQSTTLPLSGMGSWVSLVTAGFFGGYLMIITYLRYSEVYDLAWYQIV